MDRIRVRRSLVIGSGIVLGLAAVQAVAAAPPVKVGVAYTKADAHSVDNANYTTVVSMSVPAGKYQVSGRITVNNQTGATIDQMACNAYGDSAIDTGDGADLQSGQATSFPVIGVATLAAAGSIRIECISSAASPQNVGVRQARTAHPARRCPDTRSRATGACRSKPSRL
jgi:hypothetical protein